MSPALETSSSPPSRRDFSPTSPWFFHRGEGIFVPFGEKSAQNPVKPR